MVRACSPTVAFCVRESSCVKSLDREASVCTHPTHEQTTAPAGRVTLWVRHVQEESELQYTAIKDVNLLVTVDDFKSDWAAEELPSARPSHLTLGLVSCAGDEPTLAEEKDAKVLRPRRTLAAEGVTDGCWLVVSAVAPPLPRAQSTSPERVGDKEGAREPELQSSAQVGVEELQRELAVLRLSHTSMQQELQSLKTRVSHALPLHLQELAAKCLFQLRLTSEPGMAVGVGVFVSHGVAVTADHNLPHDAQRGTRVHGRVVDLSGGVTELTFTVAVRDGQQDAALLQCVDEAYAHHLEPYSGDVEELVSAHMALCSFQSAIHEQLPEFSHRVGIFHATCSKLSTHKTHALYQSLSWPGDSGASLLLHDGRLVGIHLAVVNDLEQLIEQEQSLGEAVTQLASSVRSLIAGTSHGCIALLAGAFPRMPSPLPPLR